jgi:hypothetical protein
MKLMNAGKPWGLLALLAFSVAAASVQGVEPNRTLPAVKPPRTGLEFSANPTAEELFRARVFEEPLVPIGGAPGAEENVALAAALMGYAKRSGPDDFSSLTGFLATYPTSPWRAALLTNLGLEYYNSAHYSLALEAWNEAWAHAKDATDAKGKAIADRAAGELAYMYARLGRMAELEALLKSVESRGFVGAATERITGAREGLWSMQNKPEISFKCGPCALQRILLSDQSLSRPAGSATTNAMAEIFNFPSSQKGCSLPQVAELSKKVGLDYQMAFRLASKAESRKQKAEIEEAGGFIVPSVVHWKVGHYAAMVRREGDRFLVEDPTFGNTVWATRQALEAETSGYFLIPPGDLPHGWRSVDAKEGASIWGKGATGFNDNRPTGPCDGTTGGSSCVAARCGPFGGGPSPPPSPGGGPVGPPLERGMAVSGPSEGRQSEPDRHTRGLRAASWFSGSLHRSLQSARGVSARQFHLRQFWSEVDLRLDFLHHRHPVELPGGRQLLHYGRRHAHVYGVQNQHADVCAPAIRSDPAQTHRPG